MTASHADVQTSKVSRHRRLLTWATALILASGGLGAVSPVASAQPNQCAYVCTANGDGGYTCWKQC